MSDSMFGFLGKLFGRLLRKKESAEQQPVGISDAVELKEPEQAVAPEPVQPRVAPHSSAEPVRPEKTCPKCGSPNDKFVHVCWMCKAEI